MKVLSQGNESGGDLLLGDVSEGEFRPVSNICVLREEAKIETPSLWPNYFLFLPTAISNWDCERSQTRMCGHPSLHICITSTLPFLNQPCLGYPRSRATHVGSVVCLQEDHLGKGLTQVLETGLRQAFVQGISRSQGPGGKCKKG